MAGFSWSCPHCGTLQSVTNDRFEVRELKFGKPGSADESLGFQCTAIACCHVGCKKTTVEISIGQMTQKAVNGYYRHTLDRNKPLLFDDQIIPQGTAKVQPDFVPLALRNDYYEACAIKDKSPKAAATLVRRCLQGMIRDFAGIRGNTLYNEISQLKEAVDSGVADRSISAESVTAIDEVRSIGNIGAHMEKDINVIVDVDPGEAQALIDLTEMLFDEWYGARHQRQQRLNRISEIASEKKAARDIGAGDQV